MMPVAMIVGGTFHHTFGQLGFLTPWLIFSMLFVPFCGVSLRELKLSAMHWYLLGFQVITSIAVYIALQFADRTLAQGAMICVLAPTASSAVVIAGMLGARTATMLSYSLLVNLAIAVVAPLFFATVAPAPDATFGVLFSKILWRVIPVIVLPFGAAIVLQKALPRVAGTIKKHGSVSFYLWIAALTITTAQVVNFIATQRNLTLWRGLTLAGIALILCTLQYAIGRAIGRKTGEPIAGSQSLGQKNTILAIWLTQSHLNPAASIAPAAYVLWQTIINSVQLYLKNKKTRDPD